MQKTAKDIRLNNIKKFAIGTRFKYKKNLERLFEMSTKDNYDVLFQP